MAPENPEQPAGLGPVRPAQGRRLAMLVSNGVEGDSRVQRCATTAAAAGWDVLVVGRSPDQQRHDLSMGRPGGTYRVVLVPVSPRAGVHPVAWVRSPGYRALRRRDALAGHRGLAVSHGAWRVLDPWIGDLELAMCGLVEDHRPDVIHAHDRQTIATAARSAAALRHDGHPVAWLLDAHEDVASTGSRGATGLRGRARRAMVVGEEAEWIPDADAVLTVSDDLAAALVRRHALVRRPTVVLNAPIPVPPDRDGTVGGEDGGGPDTPPPLRARLGLPADVPLLVYGGSCAPARGVVTVVEALVHLDEVHLVLVASAGDTGATVLEQRARDLGVEERLHRLDYVPAEEVTSLYRDASAGVVPLLHRPNHEISLVTKYLEYLHAGLPVVCSDVRTMADFTRRHGLGEVFDAGDSASFARAARSVLGDLDRYREAVRQSEAVAATSWDRQAKTLLALYESLSIDLHGGRHRASSRPRDAAPSGEGPAGASEGATR